MFVGVIAARRRGLVENRARPRFGTGDRRGSTVQPVVGKAAAVVVEKIVALLQRVEQAGERRDVDVGRRFRGCSSHGLKSVGLIDEQRLVGPERRIHAGAEALGVGSRCGARGRPRDRRWCRATRTLNFSGCPARVRSSSAAVRWRASRSIRRVLFVEQFVDAEVALQFEMRPVIERIAQGLRNGARPGQEFLVWRRVAGAEAFRARRWRAWRAICNDRLRARFRTGRSKRRSLAMSAGGQMAVIIEDRLRFRVLMIKSFRGLWNAVRNCRG